MREHEVPTHVQAEDKVLLWFTFPQIVAVVATCAVAYGVYRYFPFGPPGLKLGIAILLGVLGIAAVVGKVGGRGLPLVAADLLKFRLGARVYGGSPSQLIVSDPPPQPDAKPDPLRLLAKKAAGKVGNAVKAARRKGRPPFRPHSWFGKRRQRNRSNEEYRPEEVKHKKPWSRFLAVSAVGVLAVLALVLLPNIALADDPDDEPDNQPYGDAWRLDEIYFVPPEPVPGRRIFIEGVSVSSSHANVTLRAANELHLRGKAYGGRSGRTLRMGFNTPMSAGQSKSYNLSLDGPSPSFTFSWVDALGRSGAVSLKSDQIPFPLPTADGELCDLELTSLEWTPGSIAGVISSQWHRGDPPGAGPAGVRRPLQPVDPRPAGRHRHRHHRHGLRDRRSARDHGALRRRRRDSVHPDRSRREGGPRPGNHRGACGGTERAAAAHVADHPPPGPHRRVHQAGEMQLRRKLDHQDGAHLRASPGARASGGNGTHCAYPHQGGDHCPGPCAGYGPSPASRRGCRRSLRGTGGARSHARTAQSGADQGGRLLLVELAVVGRITVILLSSAAALASVAAGTPEDKKAGMLAAFDAVLTGMAYAGVGLCFFGIVWAGFVLMAEGAEGEGRGRARNAVIMAIVGLVLVLLAKGIAAAINSRIVEVFPIP